MRCPSPGNVARFAAGALLLAAGLLVAGPAGALDLSGRWRLEGGGFGPFADIVQTGDAVSVSPQGNPSLSPYVFDGTAIGELLSATSPNTICPGNPPFSLYLKIYGDEATLDGKLVQTCGGLSTSIARAFLTRCECDDGNLDDGDGCDSHCRVEPCFVCTGEPSTCLPQSDGQSCNDRNDCTTGETCAAGACANGTAVPGCLDMTGRWLRFWSFEYPDMIPPSVGSSLMRQENGVVQLRATADSGPGYAGTIDASTRALHLESPSTQLLCGAPSTMDATVDAAGVTYTGGGPVFVQTIRGCMGFGLYEEHGYRCGGGVVDPGETCVVPSCVQCSGDPAACTPLPDGTPCQNSDPCAWVATCSAGLCVPKDTVACPEGTHCAAAGVCEPWDGSGCPPCSRATSGGGCEVGPRDNCLRTADPAMSRLQLSSLSTPEKNKLRFTWKKGPAFPAAALADPVLSNNVSLCVFDESSATPALLYQADIPAGSTCGSGESCWRDDGDRGFLFHDSSGAMAGLNSVSLRPGVDGMSSVQLKGKGAMLVDSPLPGPTGFPTPALPLPLRTQLQVTGGACFEATFGADGIRRNADGVLNAVGTP